MIPCNRYADRQSSGTKKKSKHRTRWMYGCDTSMHPSIAWFWFVTSQFELTQHLQCCELRRTVNTKWKTKHIQSSLHATGNYSISNSDAGNDSGGGGRGGGDNDGVGNAALIDWKYETPISTVCEQYNKKNSSECLCDESQSKTIVYPVNQIWTVC